MCGRMSLTTPVEAVSQLFGTDERPNLAPRWNIAPTQPVMAIRVRPGFEFDDGMDRNINRRQLTHLRWGLVPGWAKEIGSKPMINARAETVLEKPSFKQAFRRRRCLVPVDSWYEWQRKDGSNQPFRFHLPEQNHGLFALGGIWEPWHSPDGSELESLALLTTEAAEDIAAIHHRMPVIIPRDRFDEWLLTREEDAASLLPLWAPEAAPAVHAYAIDTAVNNVRNDSPDLWLPNSESNTSPSEQTPKRPQKPVQGSLF